MARTGEHELHEEIDARLRARDSIDALELKAVIRHVPHRPVDRQRHVFQSELLLRECLGARLQNKCIYCTVYCFVLYDAQ